MCFKIRLGPLNRRSHFSDIQSPLWFICGPLHSISVCINIYRSLANASRKKNGRVHINYVIKFSMTAEYASLIYKSE